MWKSIQKLFRFSYLETQCSIHDAGQIVTFIYINCGLIAWPIVQRAFEVRQDLLMAWQNKMLFEHHTYDEKGQKGLFRGKNAFW